jgi:transposase
VEREYGALVFVEQQIAALETERNERILTEQDPSVDKVRQLLKLRGIGENSSWLFVMEFFGWRAFRNRREVGGLAGLTPTPYQSGGESRELGISKAGNRPVRAMAIEIAWCWLRYQPDSALTQWYRERFGHGGKRMRKVGIVALARKLLVALWRYLETGEVPAGAELKPLPSHLN